MYHSFLGNIFYKTKSGGPIRENPQSHCGFKWHRPVILPLQREGSYRCSVKPASRVAFHYRRHKTRTFVQDPCLSSLLGTGEPERSLNGPDS
ncbi:hypothetical protein ERO13_A11G030251v2, partial [Gossypium hirsutum]